LNPEQLYQTTIVCLQVDIRGEKKLLYFNVLYNLNICAWRDIGIYMAYAYELQAKQGRQTLYMALQQNMVENYHCFAIYYAVI
jgi:hypothetical protein